MARIISTIATESAAGYQHYREITRRSGGIIVTRWVRSGNGRPAIRGAWDSNPLLAIQMMELAAEPVPASWLSVAEAAVIQRLGVR